MLRGQAVKGVKTHPLLFLTMLLSNTVLESLGQENEKRNEVRNLFAKKQAG